MNTDQTHDYLYGPGVLDSCDPEEAVPHCICRPCQHLGSLCTEEWWFVMSRVPLYIFLESTKVLVSPPTPWPSVNPHTEMRVLVQTSVNQQREVRV